jgi:bifunctional DNA-binding transcriptional regulator/antitoxin component of YhaV-PrlF toxin-antitoxin module
MLPEPPKRDDRRATPTRIASKVTSKLQVTLPKALADAYGIRPGDEIAWLAAGSTITVVPAPSAARRSSMSREQREERFLRQQADIRRASEEPAFLERWRAGLGDERPVTTGATADARGWSRDDLYDDRGRR